MTHSHARASVLAPVPQTSRITAAFTAAHASLSLEAVTLVIALAGLLLAWLPGAPFRLEQFDLPKDLALGITGSVAALLLLEGQVPWRSALDSLIAACLAWGALLTVAVARNGALGWHAIGVFCASVLLFMAARRVGASSGSPVVFTGLSVVLFALLLLVLLEAFGVIPLMSSPGHRPGATLGNRNVAARVACLALPLLWFQLVRSTRFGSRCASAVVVVMAVAVIIVSRSRGAILVSSVLLIVIPIATALYSDRLSVRSVRRATWLWAVAVAIGATSVVVLPNQLRWSPADFISSVRRVDEYDIGSGRGRIIQAETTTKLIRAHWLLGVGPGNWSTWYPGYASFGDPSVRLASFYPAPLIPRNDILGLFAEFGLPGLLLMLGIAVVLLGQARSMLRRSDAQARQLGLMIGAVIGANLLLGVFDSVLRVATTLALSAIILGLALGAEAGDAPPRNARRPGSVALRRAIVLACACGAVALTRGSWEDFTALRIIMSAHTVGDMYRAASAAPNDIEAEMFLSYALIGARRCDLAQPYLTRVALLEPYSLAVRTLQKQCPQ